MARKRPIDKRKEKRWLARNREAVSSINAYIERHGLLADKLRYRPHVLARISPPSKSSRA